MICLLLAAAELHAEPATLLVLGDSISAAYGIDREAGWVALLQQRLRREGHDVRVVNASVSGATTADGRARLDGLLQEYHPAIVIIELGGNDGLRGLSINEIERNLAAMIETSQAQGATALLIGVRLPPNYGPFYNRRFRRLFETLADRYDIALVPRLLDQVADQPSLMQADGVHPVAAAQARILDNIWPQLEPLLP